MTAKQSSAGHFGDLGLDGTFLAPSIRYILTLKSAQVCLEGTQTRLRRRLRKDVLTKAISSKLSTSLEHKESSKENTLHSNLWKGLLKLGDHFEHWNTIDLDLGNVKPLEWSSWGVGGQISWGAQRAFFHLLSTLNSHLTSTAFKNIFEICCCCFFWMNIHANSSFISSLNFKALWSSLVQVALLATHPSRPGLPRWFCPSKLVSMPVPGPSQDKKKKKKQWKVNWKTTTFICLFLCLWKGFLLSRPEFSRPRATLCSGGPSC